MRKTYFYFWFFCSGILGLDQFSKMKAIQFLSSPSSIAPKIICRNIHLIYTENTGAAWGIFQKHTVLLTWISLTALICIFLFRKQCKLNYPPYAIIWGLITGGIIGNFVDRLFRGYVIDFIDFHIGTYHWPTFNVADSALCLGLMGYLLLDLIYSPKDNETKAFSRPKQK